MIKLNDNRIYVRNLEEDLVLILGTKYVTLHKGCQDHIVKFKDSSGRKRKLRVEIKPTDVKFIMDPYYYVKSRWSSDGRTLFKWCIEFDVQETSTHVDSIDSKVVELQHLSATKNCIILTGKNSDDDFFHCDKSWVNEF